MKEADDDDLVTVFRTDDPAVLPVVESLFESSGLPFVIQGNQAFHLYPVGLAGPASRHGLAVRFLVPSEFEDEAKELLTEVGDELPGGGGPDWAAADEEDGEDDEWPDDDGTAEWPDELTDAGDPDGDGDDWSDDDWNGDTDLDDDL